MRFYWQKSTSMGESMRQMKNSFREILKNSNQLKYLKNYFKPKTFLKKVII